MNQFHRNLFALRTQFLHQPVIALRRLYTEYDEINVSKLRTKMNQNTCVDFKLGYVDAKSDAIAFCVKT